jgi:hypothetical protein
MVKIIKTKISQNNEGKLFISLKLQGDPEFVQSQQTGKMYLTAKTCYVASTFDEATANALVGKELPGTIERIPCEPYEYKVESTGELITLAHRYEYKPEPTPPAPFEPFSDVHLDEIGELKESGFFKRKVA